MKSLRRKRAIRFLVLLTAIVSVAPQPGESQLNSNVASVVLTATLLESLTVSAIPSSVTFDLAPAGEAPGSSPVTITDRKSTRLNSSHIQKSRMPSSA